MLITFHGVRGSIASPGPETASFGGNTSCVHVRLDCGTHLVLDAGTGIRRLGEELVEHSEPVHVLITHSHWDHIQGMPFFAPLHQRDREILVAGADPELDGHHSGILEQLNGHNFPLYLAELPCRVDYMGPPERYFADRDFRITRRALNHPGGGSAYRLDADGASLAFVTDNELVPPGTPTTSREEWLAFCRGVDLLVHDAQYLPADMPAKHGYGHSLVGQVRELAHDAEVGCLVLYHHDPDRTDAEVDAILRESERWFRERRSPTNCLCAWEGLSIRVERDGRGRRRFALNADRPFALARPTTADLRLG